MVPDEQSVRPLPAVDAESFARGTGNERIGGGSVVENIVAGPQREDAPRRRFCQDVHGVPAAAALPLEAAERVEEDVDVGRTRPLERRADNIRGHVELLRRRRRLVVENQGDEVARPGRKHVDPSSVIVQRTEGVADRDDAGAARGDGQKPGRPADIDPIVPTAGVDRRAAANADRRHGIQDADLVRLRAGPQAQTVEILVVDPGLVEALDEIPVHQVVMAGSRRGVADIERVRIAQAADVDRAVHGVEAGRRGTDGDGVAAVLGVQHQGSPRTGNENVITPSTGQDRRREAARRVAGRRVVDSEGVAAAAGTNHQRTQIATAQNDIPHRDQAADHGVRPVPIDDPRARDRIGGVVHVHRAVTAVIGHDQAAADVSNSAVLADVDRVEAVLTVDGEGRLGPLDIDSVRPVAGVERDRLRRADGARIIHEERVARRASVDRQRRQPGEAEQNRVTGHARDDIMSQDADRPGSRPVRRVVDGEGRGAD